MSIKRLLFALLMSILGTSIQAETINCTPITALPATITAQGIYCLTHKLGTNMTSGTAITINANNVTIDLNGWKVDDGAAGSGTLAVGILSNYDNVIIKNGIVRGFRIGIELNGSGDVVQDILSDTNQYIGIWLTGTGALAEHNQVVNTGNTNNCNAFGIATTGVGATQSDNIVSGIVTGSGCFAEAIDVEGANGIVRNSVAINTAVPSGYTSYGIINQTPGGTIIVNNNVSTFTYCIFNTQGIYTYNTATNCTTDFSGGTSGLGNSGN
ncbi:MAG: hypothetical protein KGL13_02845 [Gammaproteobacteria bacterium]|nr:hypothetical protein [Gammaproteobacteria bacterium]MDE2345385.1 hypothetical protein [Gammaproteobacteria bacterium]